MSSAHKRTGSFVTFFWIISIQDPSNSFVRLFKSDQHKDGNKKNLSIYKASIDMPID